LAAKNASPDRCQVPEAALIPVPRKAEELIAGRIVEELIAGRMDEELIAGRMVLPEILGADQDPLE
jgi:hypothetical protein